MSANSGWAREYRCLRLALETVELQLVERQLAERPLAGELLAGGRLVFELLLASESRSASELPSESESLTAVGLQSVVGLPSAVLPLPVRWLVVWLLIVFRVAGW